LRVALRGVCPPGLGGGADRRRPLASGGRVGGERAAAGDRRGRDDAQRLRRRRRPERLLPGLPPGLRPGGQALPALRHGDPPDRPGGAEHVLLPSVPEVTLTFWGKKNSEEIQKSGRG